MFRSILILRKKSILGETIELSLPPGIESCPKLVLPQHEQIQMLLAKMVELEARLNENNHNSNRPPSSGETKKQPAFSTPFMALRFMRVSRALFPLSEKINSTFSMNLLLYLMASQFKYRAE